MTPILGIMASQISGHLYAPTGSMYHIASTTLSSSALTVTFSSIPADYTHLQVRWIGRGTFSDPSAGQKVNFNSDTGANYTGHLLRGDGATVYADDGASATSAAFFGRVAAATSTAGMFGGFVMDILDYANTNKYKTLRCLGGSDRNGSGEIRFNSDAWMSTTAITSMTFQITDGGNYDTYSSFSLYGVK